jgi:uncharacterized protein (DUF1330 family)
MESAQAYLKGVLPLLMGAGGQLVKRVKVNKAIKGEPSGMVLVMDFNSEEKINNLFDSDEYVELIPARDKGFAQMNIMLTEQM